MQKDDTKNENKMQSRKFVVWLVWLIITVLIVVFGVILRTESSMSLIDKVLDSFFSISMMYLGMNVGQKIGFAISDAIKGER